MGTAFPWGSVLGPVFYTMLGTVHTPALITYQLRALGPAA